MEFTNADPKAPLRVLVALASYGTSNDCYLNRLLDEYRSMSFDMDVVIISNIEKKLAPEIESLVGLPNKNPWSLPFSHKKLFSDRVEKYDLFVYSEDDVLITEKHLRAFVDVTAVLRDDEVAGFLRIEKGSDGEMNYPDAHTHFHWDPASVRSRGAYTLANFTNEHAACYVLTRAQLKKSIKSGGFAVDPHEGKYDLLCTAATDPYTQCGFTKLIPVSHIDDFIVHHLSNKYVDKMGMDEPEMRRQIDALLKIAHKENPPASLIDTETKLWRGTFSKNYYEPVSHDVISMIPKSARSVLSIGCGWGATEIRLAEKGLQVSAIPLDPVVSRNAAERGVEMVYGDFRSARASLDGGHFDCVLYLNVLHLMRDPVEVLSLFGGVSTANSSIIIQSPNMRCIPRIWQKIRSRRFEPSGNYELTGVHFTFAGKVREWCRRAGLVTDRTVGILHRRAGMLRGVSGSIAGLSMAPDFISVARKADASATPMDKAVRFGSGVLQ